MRKRCPNCSIKYSKDSQRIYLATGEKFCEDCNVHELIEYYENINGLNQKGWKWRNYYGIVPDNSSGNIIRRIAVPTNLFVPKNMCFECRVNNRMNNILLCEDCDKQYVLNCNTKGLVTHCKFCSIPSNNSYCITCMRNFERRKIILLTLSISDKSTEKNKSKKNLFTKKEQTFSLGDVLG
jgi:hypothetical protein